MSRRVDISIVVPCRNEVRHIRPFLDCLLAQDFAQFKWEAIIADGMSTDGTREAIDEYGGRAPVRRIDNPEKIVSTGLNRAIREAAGEYVIRMDMHTDYAPDYVRRSVEILLESGAWNAGGPARTKASGWMASAIAAAYHSPFACGGARFHDEDYEGPVDTVTYGCWRKSTLERLGLFDETLVRNQDDEFNLRTVRAGGLIWQSPRIVSWYYPRSSLAALFRQYFQYGFWKVAVIRKHRIPASWRHLAPGAFVLFLAGGPLFAALLWILGAGGAARAAAGSWAIGTLVYMSACLAAAVWTARRYGWRLLPVLPEVFACYHISYGAGFLLALAWLPFSGRQAPAGKLFTELTR
jgi:glycosyltransferase involved in cell wall biosynthesis